MVRQGRGFQVVHVARECLAMWGSPTVNLPPTLVANFTCGVEAADPRSRLLVSHSLYVLYVLAPSLAPPRELYPRNPKPCTVNLCSLLVHPNTYTLP